MTCFAEYCSTPEIKRAEPYKDGWHLTITFVPVQEHLDSGIFGGYFAYAKQVDGSITGFGYSNPSSTATTSFRIKLYPNENFTVTMGAYSFKGRGFFMGNSVFGHTIQARKHFT